ncbi:hypothetical protein DZF91_35585 [Actinomadura logoneensis]|uniref:Uncharacterized protein n=1 Tax=Actinomadura logoneensis TaxID=2293572 RepID=A0A372JA98_9ACTN|nr:hypothetical protein [Actinomadura logoneensis]RFU36923.1 hypothetical protein DZF91_35585 [Actinomadura logoneensis]
MTTPRTKREERMLTAVQAEVPGRYATRRGRRNLVRAGIACLALFYVSAVVCWALAPSDTAMYVTFACDGLGLLAGGFVLGRMVVVTRGTTRLPDHLLDERQAAEKLRAHSTAHRLTVLLLFVALFGIELGMRSDVRSPSAAVVVTFGALLVTVASLPLLVSTWRMPDPVPDEDDA